MNEVEDLQVRISFQEDALQELNITIARQQSELDILRKELLRLQDRLLDLEQNQPENQQPGDTEIPPHY